MQVVESRIFADMSAAEYHADPAPKPSLSAGVAIPLVTQTPLHAWMKHPRLNAEWRESLGLENDTNGASRFGTVAHELLLGRGAGIHIMQAVYGPKHEKAGQKVTDYKTDAAKKERDEVLKQGWTPCFEHELVEAEELVDLIRGQVQAVPGCEGVFQEGEGRGEVAAFAYDKHYGVWTRCLVDWWCNNGDVYDLKTSTTDLSDEALVRKIGQDSLDLRAAFYERVLTTIRPDLLGRMRYRFVFVQQKAPFELRVVELSRNTMWTAHKKVALALQRWSRCLHTNQWPGYPKRIELMEPPKWDASKWENREEWDEELRAVIARDPFVGAITTDSYDRLELTEIAS